MKIYSAHMTNKDNKILKKFVDSSNKYILHLGIFY